MKLNSRGYMLLEVMIAMTVILLSILMIVSSINFLLLDEKKCKDELELAIMLYEMVESMDLPEEKREIIQNKSVEKGFIITDWQRSNLRIESEELFLEIIRE